MPGAAILVRLRVASAVALLSVLAACASHYGSTAYRHGGTFTRPSRYYPPPGPSDDPWGPYVREAASRYRVPEQWIREVMRQESAGQEQAVSSAGAIGLMQIMPDTYDDLRQRYALGGDPFEPRDNIMAGAAYIREMADRYGAPGFLAAYNAGPSRMDSFLIGGEPLPDETVNYVASIAPRIGSAGRMTGPPVAYPRDGKPQDTMSPVAIIAAGNCDPDAAYDPDRSCAPALRPAAAPAASTVAGGCDADAAYDPSQPCPGAPAGVPVLVASQSSLYQPVRPIASASGPAAAQRGSIALTALSGGGWAVQVGAFSSPMLARTAAVGVRDAIPDLLGVAQIELLPTSPFGGRILYRARLSNISARTASAVCARLTAEQQPCLVIAPGQAS